MKGIDKSKIALVFLAAALLVAAVYVIYEESTPEWKKYQKMFYRLVAEKLGKEKAEAIEFGIKQIYIPELNRVDRCITCHMGMEWEGLEREKNPFKKHPVTKLIEKHPFKKFGCTICHGGQGYATTFKEAHGPTRYWDEPVLGSRLEQLYGFRTRGVLLQINCNVCHRYERETKGMDYINLAKRLVGEKACRACHIINGIGGSIGPDLTHEGSKPKELFAMPGIRSVFEWHFRHFRSPKDIVFNTIMPDFEFTRKEARALTMLVMSWKDVTLPSTYFPGVKHHEELTEKEKMIERMRVAGEGAFFAKKGCFTCHSVTVFHIVSPTNIGPDLSFAKEDVRRRFGVPLEMFMENPSGTMQIVLETIFPLTKEEKKEVIKLLNRAWEIKVEKNIPAPWERFRRDELIHE